ncbi:hypothetical protein [Ornithinimicrobium sp. INDO-MA30-4]|uniref:hypothetical protein n=1 Tax=Ornithinimicrobium sp. INDO-MA30-4 TaxID=2908651 RepID=UPI001F447826|nr:hypothetical protein [Ornithinimicrobium sp. INDO-MA30-4]UJH70071.1 hypothetical protein L0A91_12820 [Ornithinimicrobium sp. INDO-MA30-4]
MIDAASDSAQCNEVAESALATTLTRGAANEPVVSTVNVEGLRVFVQTTYSL